MKEKTKEFLKKYLIGFILGIVSACTISVIAATYFPSNQTTYDNSNTELKSENVQDAIDELYGVCFPPSVGDTILDNVDIVTSGDGLYEDEYEEGKYTYKGNNPNNYVYFNCTDINNQSFSTCEIWRIISISADKTIKIMKLVGMGEILEYDTQIWDANGNNNWARPSTLNTYLNGDYYNSLNSTAKSQIVAKDWGIGAVAVDDNNMANTISDENSKKWNGKVALVTVSEYIRNNSNKSKCGAVNQMNFFNNNHYTDECLQTGWMYYSSSSWWTLTPFEDDDAFYVYNGDGYIAAAYTFNSNVVFPALYLSSDVKITGGDGSYVSPFELG